MPISYRADVIFSKCFFNLKILACQQQSRVERSGLDPYYRNFEITSNCWRTIDQKNAETYQKRYPKPKDKKAIMRWNEGRKSNKIKSHTRWGGQPRKWKKIILLKFSNRNESPELLISLPSLQVWQWEEEPPEILLWRQTFSDLTVLGETEISLLKRALRVSCIPGHRRRNSDLLRDWARRPC